MSTLRISDAPLLPDVEGTEKIPTGGRGDYAISVDQIKGHIFQDIGKELVGLGNVDNTSDLDKPVSTAQQAALDLKADKTYVDNNLDLKADKTNVYTRSETTLALSQKADLVGGVIPENQIPSSFNDVLEFTTSNLPIVGESGKIYVTTDNNKTWRWGGNKYVEISGWNPDSVSKIATLPTYYTPEAGVDPVTGVHNGAYYNVRSPDDDSFLLEYQNVGGSAVATGKSYPSGIYVEAIAKYTALPFKPGKRYALHEGVQLDNGDIVKSTIDGNTTDPNVNMLGWIPLSIMKFSEDYGATGNGVSDDSSSIQNSILAGNGVLRGGKTYLISSDVVISSNHTGLTSNGGVATLKTLNGAKLIVSGTKTTTSTTLTSSVEKPSSVINVSSSLGFAIGDYVEITGAMSEAENSLKDPQRELNIIKSISGNTITLGYSSGHTYLYDPSFTQQATVTKVIPVKHINIDKVLLDGVFLDFRYVDDLRLNASGLQSGINSYQSASLNLDITFNTLNNTTSGGNAAVFICGAKDSVFNITINGSKKDAVRFWGCSDSRYNVNLSKASERYVWKYQCNNVSTERSTITSDTVSSSNFEILLFDYSTNCHYKGTIDARYASDLTSVVEYRISTNCSVSDSEIHTGALIPITIKARSKDSKLTGNNIYCYRSSANLVDYQELSTVSAAGDVSITDNKVYSRGANTQIGLFRTVSSTQLAQDINNLIDISRNYLERGTGFAISIIGTGIGGKLGVLRYENNTFSKGDISTGSLGTVTVPFSSVSVSSNKNIGDVGTRTLNINNVDLLYVSGNDANRLALTNCSKVILGENNFSASHQGLSAENLYRGVIKQAHSYAGASIPADSSIEFVVPVTGLVVGSGSNPTSNLVNAFAPSNLPLKLSYTCCVKDSSNVSIRLINPTSTEVTVPLGIWVITVAKVT